LRAAIPATVLSEQTIPHLSERAVAPARDKARSGWIEDSAPGLRAERVGAIDPLSTDRGAPAPRFGETFAPSDPPTSTGRRPRLAPRRPPAVLAAFGQARATATASPTGVEAGKTRQPDAGSVPALGEPRRSIFQRLAAFGAKPWTTKFLEFERTRASGPALREQEESSTQASALCSDFPPLAPSRQIAADPPVRVGSLPSPAPATFPTSAPPSSARDVRLKTDVAPRAPSSWRGTGARETWPGFTRPDVSPARSAGRVADAAARWPSLPARSPSPPQVAMLPSPRLEQLSRDQEEGRWNV
jgi:hypothetical protein